MSMEAMTGVEPAIRPSAVPARMVSTHTSSDFHARTASSMLGGAELLSTPRNALTAIERPDVTPPREIRAEFGAIWLNLTADTRTSTAVLVLCSSFRLLYTSWPKDSSSPTSKTGEWITDRK